MNEIVNVLETVAREAGTIIKEASREQIGSKTKSNFRDVVTKYDVLVQEKTLHSLKEAFPDAAFISEECDDFQPKENSLTFVIDPIDGTANFVHHLQHSCISISCVKDHEPVAAVVYDPFLEELFSAQKGSGAFLNGQPIHVTDRSLKESLVLFGSAPYNMELEDETFRNIRSVFRNCQDIRRSGSAALDLCNVAAGRIGLFFESILSVWDYAAGALIIREAGGLCKSLQDTPLIFDRPVKCSVIAGSEKTIAESGLLSASFLNMQEVSRKYEALTRRLIHSNTTITTMESCTAGQIASLITDTEGSSAILKGAFVTYSNEAKLQQNVPEEIIKQYGIYSSQTAAAMAEACRRAYGADIGLGVTGSFANADPANQDSVPGEVYFAIATKDGTRSYQLHVEGQPSRLACKWYVADAVAERLMEQLCF